MREHFGEPTEPTGGFRQQFPVNHGSDYQRHGKYLFGFTDISKETA